MNLDDDAVRAAGEAYLASDAEARLAGNNCANCGDGDKLAYAGMEERYRFCNRRACWHVCEHWCNHWKEKP